MQTNKNSSSRHIHTVSEITQEIKLILQNAFTEVWVEGEISNFRAYPSGHFYFTLKDEKALLQAVMFGAAYNKDIKFKFENGLNLICFGRIGIYEKEGKYQLYVQRVEPKGIGSLQLALEQLKQKLEKEGLFAVEHKRPIPYLPSKIGVVTSLSGAAIKDILKVLDRRFSAVQIIISPAQVQGENAKEDLSRAIKELSLFNDRLPAHERIEVIIVGRGGGSIEDLWAFNEELVARAIYNSKIPVISAVGHERDWTIADLVADLRAPTPSVAAELVIPKREDLRERLDGLSDELKKGIQNLLKLSASEFETCQKRLLLLNPVVLIQQHKTRLSDLARQINVRLQHFMELRQAGFNKAVERLSALSPLNILGRGYSITFKMPESVIIKDAKLVKAGDSIKTRLHKGEILSQVMEVDRNG